MRDSPAAGAPRDALWRRDAFLPNERFRAIMSPVPSPPAGAPATSPATAAPAIASPCVKMCAIEPLSGLCEGCGRSLREIGAWTSYAPQMRAAIMATLPARLARLKAAASDTFPD